MTKTSFSIRILNSSFNDQPEIYILNGLLDNLSFYYIVILKAHIMIVCTKLDKLKLTARSAIRSNQTCGRFCKSLNNRVNFAINSNPNQAGYLQRTLKLFMYYFGFHSIRRSTVLKINCMISIIVRLPLKISSEQSKNIA